MIWVKMSRAQDKKLLSFQNQHIDFKQIEEHFGIYMNLYS